MKPPAPPPSLPTPGAGPRHSPLARLLQRPQGFELHQAVQLLQRWLQTLPPQARPTLHFCNTLSLAFPASEIASLHGTAADGAGPAPDAPPAELGRIEITPTFLGLLGVGGVLPYAYSELLSAHETLQRDSAARAFLDLFQHRVVTLFHAAWLRHRLPLQAHARDPGRERALSLLGLGHPALHERLQPQAGGVGDAALAYHAGTLQRRCTSAATLQALLADYLGVPVRIDAFAGRWCALEPQTLSRLGTANAALGVDALLGARAWQRNLRLRVCLGPLDAAQQQRFLPGRSGALALRELLTLLSGPSLEYELRLCLRAAAVSPTRLQPDRGNTGFAPRLGWNTFLLTRPNGREREEAVCELHAGTP